MDIVRWPANIGRHTLFDVLQKRFSGKESIISVVLHSMGKGLYDGLLYFEYIAENDVVNMVAGHYEHELYPAYAPFGSCTIEPLDLMNQLSRCKDNYGHNALREILFSRSMLGYTCLIEALKGINFSGLEEVQREHRISLKKRRKKYNPSSDPNQLRLF